MYHNVKKIFPRKLLKILFRKNTEFTATPLMFFEKKKIIVC